MRIWQWVLLILAFTATAFAGVVFYQIHSLKVEQVTDDLHVAFGLGGNVGILRTGEGTVIVDTLTLSYQGDRIRAVAEELTGEPFTMVEELDNLRNYERDLKPWDVAAETRALAEVCLVLLNSNAFSFLY